MLDGISNWLNQPAHITNWSFTWIWLILMTLFIQHQFTKHGRK